MSDPGNVDDADSIDTGEPIEALSRLEAPVSSTFLDRVRSKIERRGVTNEFASMFWQVPVLLVLEFLEIIFAAVPGRTDDDKRGKS